MEQSMLKSWEGRPIRKREQQERRYLVPHGEHANTLGRAYSLRASAWYKCLHEALRYATRKVKACVEAKLQYGKRPHLWLSCRCLLSRLIR